MTCSVVRVKERHSSIVEYLFGQFATQAQMLLAMEKLILSLSILL